MQQSWNKMFPYASFQSDADRGPSRKGRTNDNSYTNMANTTLVSSSVRDVNAMLTAVDTISRSTVRSSRKQTLFSSKQETNVSGLEGYRKSLEMEGISSNAATLISQSSRPGSITSCKSAWHKWTSWYVRKKIDPFCAPLSKIVNYLSILFDEGLLYRTVNVHRSAISAYHNFINGEPIGKHPKICPLLAGIFNERPPQARYTFIWNVDVVLTYIKNNMSVSSQLSEKNLTCKLTVLLALSSALRASSIQHLNINFMAKTKSCYKFYLNKLDKSWRKCQAPTAVTYQEYTQNESLYVVRTLDEYIARTERWRSAEEHSQLLLSFIHPEKPVVFCTISGWLKTVLMKSGIDTSNFKAHSTRSASTSKAGLQGASKEDILKWESWSNKSTWQRFYNKNIVEGG